jgi:hypothetical protein
MTLEKNWAPLYKISLGGQQGALQKTAKRHTPSFDQLIDSSN